MMKGLLTEREKKTWRLGNRKEEDIKMIQHSPLFYAKTHQDLQTDRQSRDSLYCQNHLQGRKRYLRSFASMYIKRSVKAGHLNEK